MGSSKNVLNYHLVQSQTLSSGFSSGTVGIPYLDNVGLQINVTTNNSTGTFTVNVSNDNVNFIPLTLSNSIQATGANDVICVSLNQVPFRYMYVGYAVASAGTGSCDVWITAKEIG